MVPDEPQALAREDEKRLLAIAVVVAFVLIAVIAVVSYLVWDPHVWDPALARRPTIIMYVPVPILEWAFAGAMVAVLYRLAYRIRIKSVGCELYTWIVAKPFIGLFMGALIYFVALAGAKLLDGPPEALEHALWLNVVAFVGGFSDDLSVGLIQRFVRHRLGSSNADEEKPSQQA